MIPKPRRPRWTLLGGLAQRWLVASGREAYQSARASVLSPEGRGGAAMGAGLFLAGWVQCGPWSAYGLPAEGALGHIRSALWAWEALWQAALLLAHLALGAGWGAAAQNAWALLGDIVPALHPRRLSTVARGAAAATAALLLHVTFLLGDMARRPALYVETFQAEGVLHDFAARRCPFWALDLLAATAWLAIALAAVQVGRRLFQRWRKVNAPTRLALIVTAAGLGLFGAGLWGVARWQADRNRGPNLLLIVVDSLRADALAWTDGGRPAAPRMTDLARRGWTFSAVIPPLADASGPLATLMTGRDPLAHGVRHSFSPQEDMALDADALPARLRRAGHRLSVVADAGGDFFSRTRQEYHRVRSASLRAADVLAQRTLERSPHLLPYFSGDWGRRLVPPLRNLAPDPLLLAAEAGRELRRLRFQKRFSLIVFFSALRQPMAAASPAAREYLRDHPSPAGPGYTLPWPHAAVEASPERAATLYKANLAAVDDAVGRILDVLEKGGLAENTWVALWSSHGMHLGEGGRGVGHGRHLRGTESLYAPFILLSPGRKQAPRRIELPVPARDVAPTLLEALGLDAPPVMEGASLFQLRERRQGPEPIVIYSETAPWLLPEHNPLPAAERIAYPDAQRILEEDREAPGRFRVSPQWEDHVLVAKHRMVQVDNERLVYVPTRRGVRFELYDLGQDPGCAVDLAGQPARAERVRELKELFYSALGAEWGWRPQNEFWIPEALLKE